MNQLPLLHRLPYQVAVATHVYQLVNIHLKYVFVALLMFVFIVGKRIIHSALQLYHAGSLVCEQTAAADRHA